MYEKLPCHKIKFKHRSKYVRTSVFNNVVTWCLAVKDIWGKKAFSCFFSNQGIVHLAETAHSWQKQVPETFCFGHFLSRGWMCQSDHNVPWPKTVLFLRYWYLGFLKFKKAIYELIYFILSYYAKASHY